MADEKQLTLDEQREGIMRSRQYRGLAFKMQKYPGVELTGEEEALVAEMEALPGFISWETFGVNWDIKRDVLIEEGRLEIEKLLFSREEEWDAKARAHAFDVVWKS